MNDSFSLSQIATGIDAEHNTQCSAFSSHISGQQGSFRLPVLGGKGASNLHTCARIRNFPVNAPTKPQR
jgi:hypothetical protein